MTNDARFGLPLSLVEALKADPSPTAASLADLLEQDGPPRRAGAARGSHSRPWQAVLTGLALSVSLGAQSYAATPGLQGRWIMAAAQSRFDESVTGPAPDAAILTVTRDDEDRLAYELVETRRGAEVARGSYDVSLEGRSSTSAVDGVRLAVSGVREPAGGVIIRAPAVDGVQASIHLLLTGRDSATLEHDVSSPAGAMRLETINLVRSHSE